MCTSVLLYFSLKEEQLCSWLVLQEYIADTTKKKLTDFCRMFTNALFLNCF